MARPHLPIQQDTLPWVVRVPAMLRLQARDSRVNGTRKRQDRHHRKNSPLPRVQSLHRLHQQEGGRLKEQRDPRSLRLSSTTSGKACLDGYTQTPMILVITWARAWMPTLMRTLASGYSQGRATPTQPLPPHHSLLPRCPLGEGP